MKALLVFNTVAVVINLLLRKNGFYFYRLWTNKITNHNIFVVRRKNIYIHHTLGLHIISSTTLLDNNIIKVTQSYILLQK